jgi:hypothetical protein
MPDERRRYFRIEDTVSFTVEPIDVNELQTQIDDFWDDQQAYAVRHQFNHQLEQHLADFKMIEKNMPELARYLSVLQTQIDNLTAKVLPEQTSIANNTQKISLSGQGMAYTSDQKLTTDDTVELYLKLLPTGQMIKIYAQVVEVESLSTQISEQISEQYRISLDFTHIYESDQELLIKRIHAQQLKDIAAARSTAN